MRGLFSALCLALTVGKQQRKTRAHLYWPYGSLFVLQGLDEEMVMLLADAEGSVS